MVTAGEQAIGSPVGTTLNVIGGKWKIGILHALLEGTKRFGELQKIMPTVTQRMLAMRLRELETDQLVRRKVYAEVPPRVEYSLTEFGQSLEPVLRKIERWGVEYTAHQLKGQTKNKRSSSKAQ